LPFDKVLGVAEQKAFSQDLSDRARGSWRKSL